MTFDFFYLQLFSYMMGADINQTFWFMLFHWY